MKQIRTDPLPQHWLEEMKSSKQEVEELCSANNSVIHGIVNSIIFCFSENLYYVSTSIIYVGLV